MNCIAIFDSGNYAYRVCSELERKGMVFEVVSIPCKIAKQGCGYCLRFPEEYIENVKEVSELCNILIREIYTITKGLSSNSYTKIYPE